MPCVLSPPWAVKPLAAPSPFTISPPRNTSPSSSLNRSCSLKNGGILRSKRGVGGGYQMQSLSTDITLRQVVELIDGPFQPIPCCENARTQSGTCECGVVGGCGLGRTLLDLQSVVQNWLDTTTIAHVIARSAPPQALTFEI